VRSARAAIVMLAAALVNAALLSTPAAAEPGPCPGCTAVFYSGLNGSACFRIPSIIKTHTGTLLAFAENRMTDCGDNGKHHALVLRRSSDGGKTWGQMSTVVEGTVPCPGCPAALSNPNPVEVTLADGKKAVLMHYDTMNNPRGANHGLDKQIWSFDDGVSWVHDEVIAYPPQKNVGGLVGPSVGIQAQDGTIYFSTRGAGAVEGKGGWLYWSKDFGKSWQASQATKGAASECSIAFKTSAADGTIIMNCRTGTHNRAQLEWAANGTLLKPAVYPKELIDPGCQGSLINQMGVLHTSNANTTSGRTHVTVKSSLTQGATWSQGTLVWQGPSGYSQLVSLGDSKTVGILLEAGRKSTYETISFAVVTL
jgi:sialidase-1